MPAQLTVRNIPDEVYARLKASATLHQRSLNSEAIACLKAVLLPGSIDAGQRLERVRALREGVEVRRSSGNVYADLRLPDAKELKIKTGLVIEIRKAIRRLGLTQVEAGKRMGLTQPEVSGMMRGDLSNLSERKLMDCLTKLGYDIEISVRPARARAGHLVLAAA